VPAVPPPESKPTAVRIGGRGGFIEPEVAGFGAGLSSSFCIDAQCCLKLNHADKSVKREGGNESVISLGSGDLLKIIS